MSTTRADRWHLGLTARAVCLWGLGTLAGAGLVLTAVLGLRTTGEVADELRSRSLPASRALSDAAFAASAGQDAFMEAIETTDPAARVAAITAAEAHGRRQEGAWQVYLDHAYGSAEEEALQADYLAAAGRSRELAAALLSLAPNDPTRPAVLANEQRESAKAVGALASIETELYAATVDDQAARVESGIHRTRASTLIAAAGLTAIFTGAAALFLRGTRRDERLFDHEANELRLAGEAAELEGSLQRGLEMAPTEDAAFGILRQALAVVAPDVPTEVLLADSSQAHFHQTLSTSETGEGCAVGGPAQCPAANSGQTWVFEDSRHLDSCPHLRESDHPVWATCVPVSIGGRATGVIHAQRPLDQPLPDRLVTGLELVARKAGDRIAAIRILAKTEAEAQVDPLTGLPNRRTLENQVKELRVTDDRYVVAFADLDHFKAINDAHGHETGDRALRLFARVLRDSIRPRDLVARFGGEEFVAVLPDCSMADAQAVAERIRARLAQALGHASLPVFTVTIGLAPAEPGDPFADITARADVAMLQGKSLGRDRVLVAGDEWPPSPSPALTAAAS
ncbi:MAG: GGDEF domain-containing protein [Acidimicrobiales bacterium]